MEKFYQIVTSVSADNGDGIYDMEDTYGLSILKDWPWNAFVQASDIYVVSKNNNGKLELTINTERTMTLIDYVTRLSTSNSVYNYPNGQPDKVMKLPSGQCLFDVNALSDHAVYRASEYKFGILPYPMLDADQEGYKTFNWNGYLCVPGNAKDKEFIGNVTELLAYKSESTVVEAYYETVLGTRVADTVDDYRMIELIFDSLVTDLGLAFSDCTDPLGKCAYILSQNYVDKDSPIALTTFFRQWGGLAEKQVATITQAFK